MARHVDQGYTAFGKRETHTHTLPTHADLAPLSDMVNPVCLLASSLSFLTFVVSPNRTLPLRVSRSLSLPPTLALI
jgi:hypothetical protein